MNAMKTAVCLLALVPFAACGEPPIKKVAEDVIVITDDEPMVEPNDAPTIVEVSDFSDLEIELTWSTPSDPDQTDRAGADLDLHFRHPSGQAWNEAPFDIYWDNPTADWGEAGPQDDPMLELEDDDGLGPELLSYDGVADDMYFEVGVHYVDDGGYGVSYPTVRVFRDGELMFQRDSRLEAGSFWHVARVSTDNALLLDVISTDMPHH